MPKFIVVTRQGQRFAIEGPTGTSVMHAITQGGVDELLAICGGSLSCATCHVFVDDEHRGMLPKMSANEDALLDGSKHRKEASRLSCQIILNDVLDGLCVTIAPEE